MGKSQTRDQTTAEQQQWLAFSQATPADSSNTIELLDAVPKYFFRGIKGCEIEFVDKANDVAANIIRTIEHKGETIEMSLSPALIRTPVGNTRRFPGPREELIDHTLRRLAARNLARITVQDEKNVLLTTLSEIRRDLANHSHSHKLSEIHEGLLTLAGVTLEIRSIGQSEMSSSKRPRRRAAGDTTGIIRYIYNREDDTEGDGFVRIVFHDLFYRSLQEATYRQINYGRLTALRKPLARWLYQRISHHFTQAEITTFQSHADSPYSLSLSFIRDNAGIRAKDTREAARQVREALQECCEDKKRILSPERRWDERPTYSPSSGGRRGLVDILFDCFLSRETVQEIIETNKRMQKARAKLGIYRR